MTGKRKRGTAYNPTKTTKRKKRASVPASSPHPHGDFDEETFYQVRTVLAERVVGRKILYQIDWEDDKETGEKYKPTWEPKKNLTEVALDDWEKLKLAKQAELERPINSSVAGPQATPIRRPAKRNKVRRVLSSSPTSSAAQNQQLAATPVSPTRSQPIEIEESPEASGIGASYQANGDDSPLFVPQDDPLDIPSQDLAFVRPSAPPSSYQNYDTLRSSQTGSAIVLPDSSQPGPSQLTPKPSSSPVVIGDPDTAVPVVLATSQNQPSANPTPDLQSTGRIIPDSQSLPTSLNFVSRLPANTSPDNSQEAASQLVEDFQIAADATPGETVSSSQVSESQALPPARSSLSPAQVATGVHSRSSQRSAEQRPRSTPAKPDEPQRAISVASASSPITPTLNVSSQDFSSKSNKEQDSQAAQELRHQTQSQPAEDSEAGTSFPFETQVASARSKARTTPPAHSLPLSHSQPVAGSNPRLRDALGIVTRAQTDPVQDDSAFSLFPSVPSYPLTHIGESAPPLPDIPSTPIRRSIEVPTDMDGNTPTSEPKMSMTARIKAMRAKKAAERSETPTTAASSQITSAKPSAVPPRLNAELAAESPSRNGTPESSRNGGRSPSAVPAALPIATVTQDEMNTSGRYKTLLPQGNEHSSLRRQSTITGTASKEGASPGNYVHSVPIALMGHQRDQYHLAIQTHKDVIERFLGTNGPSEELILETETVLERLRKIVVHPDLDNVETYTQYDVPPAAHAQWAIDCSAKFHFLKHLIDELRDSELSIALICQSGQLLQILEHFLLGLNVSCYRADTGQTCEREGCALTFKILSPNEDISSDSLAADAIICMDNSAEAGGPALKLLQGNTGSKLVMMALAVPGTIEHVERCLSPNLTHQQKLRALVHGVFDLRESSGKLEHGQLPSDVTAKVIAHYITSSDAEIEWSVAALSMLENLDSQTESDIELPQSSEPVHIGDKRSFDGMEIEIPATDTFKRPRLASNGVHAHDQPVTINPLELDISHVSDSITKLSHQIVDSAAVPDSSDLNETVKRLQSLLLTAQTSLAEHKHDLGELQYRHEDQRAQIVELTRKNDDAIDTAQKAVARMTEGAATTSALRTENRSLKDELKTAKDALVDHSVPERAAFEQQRIALEQAQKATADLEKRFRTQQRDLDYAQEMYQNSSSAAQRLGTTNKELENALVHTQNRATGEQARAKQMTLDARAQNLSRENKQLKAKLREQADALSRKDKELGLLKEASRGRMGTRGSSVPRSPRMGSPLKNAAGSRQSSPSAGELKGRHPLRQS